MNIELGDAVPVETVTISKKKYNQLLENSNWLECLESAGVDNWEGWDYAVDIKNGKE